MRIHERNGQLSTDACRASTTAPFAIAGACLGGKEMDRETRRIVESYRRDEAGPLENNVIDELRQRGARPSGVPAAARRCSGSAPARSARFCASPARPTSRTAHRSRQCRQAARSASASPCSARRSSRTCSTKEDRSRSQVSPASTSRSRRRRETSRRGSPRAGGRTPTQRCGRSSSAEACGSTTARR